VENIKTGDPGTCGCKAVGQSPWARAWGEP